MADIAINPVVRRVQFTGNTGLGPFAFTFNILQNTDIIVYKNTTLLTLTTDYTVTINANGTGSVTLTGSGSGTALITTDNLTIIGGRELSRTTDFVTAGDLLASSLNEQLDSNVIMSQQLDERFSRTISVSPGDADKTLTLPTVDDRKDKILKFDTEGNVEAAAASTVFANTVVGANFVNDVFTGTGAQTAFTLSTAPGSKNNCQIYIDGVYQEKSTFSINSSTLTFTEAPPLNASIEVIIGNALDSFASDANAVNYDQGGTGYVSRTVESKLQEFVSVKDFGAVGDGVVDDTAAIQAAIDSFTDGGIVTFPSSGKYKCSNVILAAGVSLIGQGNSKDELTEIVGGDATKPIFKAVESVSTFYGITISGFYFNAGSSTAAIEIGKTNFINIRDNSFNNLPGYAVYVSSQTNVCEISNNYINNSGDTQLNLGSFADGRVENNLIQSGQNNGIVIGASNNVIQGNYVTLSAELGISDAAGNNIYDSNIIQSNGKNGLSIGTSASKCIIKGNHIYNNNTSNTADRHGIQITSGSEHIISGNIISQTTGNQKYCIRLGSSVSDVIIADNVLTGFDTGAIDEQGAQRTRIFNNITQSSNTTSESHTGFSLSQTMNFKRGSDIASPASGELALGVDAGNYFHITGTNAITSIASADAVSGRMLILKFNDALTFTDGSNLKLAGNFSTSAGDTITLICDGTNFWELSRSVN